MKKFFMLVIGLSIIGIFISCIARENSQPASEKKQDSNEQLASEKKQDSNEQPAPEKPEFFVIDSYKARGDLEDNVRLYNKTTRTGISFTVFLLDPKDDKWKVYGTGNLKGPGDTEYISSKLSGDLKKYRYFAIQAKDTRKYRYDFEKSHDDLYIHIYDK
jgi:lipopolysaccharide export LptBFGC system permease protein LptF